MSFEHVTRKRFSQGNIITLLVYIYLMAMIFVPMVIRHTICLHSWHYCTVLFLATLWHSSSTKSEGVSWG